MTKKPKRKLTPEQKAAKAKRRREYETVFINGKQKRVKREPTIDGIPVDEFIQNNADPIWLHQHERWEEIEPYGGRKDATPEFGRDANPSEIEEGDYPF